MIKHNYFSFIFFALFLFSFNKCELNKDLEEVYINFIKLSKLGSKIKSYFSLNISDSEVYTNSTSQSIIFSNKFIEIGNKIIKHLTNLNKVGSRILEINLRKYENILVDLNEVYINLNLTLTTYDPKEKEKLSQIRQDLIKVKSSLSTLLITNKNLVKIESVMY